MKLNVSAHLNPTDLLSFIMDQRSQSGDMSMVATIQWTMQHTSFPEIFTALRKEGSERNQKDVKRNLQGIGSSLYQLNPMLKDELIVVREKTNIR